ncbi:glycerate kinase [Lentilactobacillus sp. SPB1-3]|uniref:Glycerate kinase n=1 Tax=Lentilactobacillus terminaliae TaxID=3003483 RepID=A0ACD5DDQ8_9LACO|nr:glycerate kinase [Lentilactobacillus sp. SPB1-3]MCZ0977658.1 glycerate kinase [Lentilactobacillus sp. SPB1-3]
MDQDTAKRDKNSLKIVIAPDSYKGYLTAEEAAQAIKAGCEQVLSNADYCLLSLADGGEGTVATLIRAKNGRRVAAQVENPFGEIVSASYGLIDNGQTAVIEMAAASGFEFIDFQHPQVGVADTYGTGQLILDALNHRVTKIIIGLGGSATNDGGAGLLTAVGVKLLDSNQQPIPRGGLGLAQLAKIDVSDIDQRFEHVEIVGATDVTNPLTGPEGASVVFGPQKGADDTMVARLDQALVNYSAVIRKDLGIEINDVSGAGAAGGLGAGLVAGLHARLTSGIQLILSEMSFEDAVQDADLVITGEGSIDSQTQYGKAPSIVAQQARLKASTSYILGIGGRVGEGIEGLYEQGFNQIEEIQVSPELGDPKANAQENLTITVAKIIQEMLTQDRLPV